jgi:hypothetical protein
MKDYSNRTIVVDKHEGVWDRCYVEDLERAGAIALNLADQLNEKIDECEALKKEVKWYVERVVTLEKQLHEEV